MRRTRPLVLLAAVGAVGLVAGCGAPSPDAGAGVPALRTRAVVTGLQNPWDVARLPNGDLLMTERDRARVLVRDAGTGAVRAVGRPANAWVSGETGLMSVALAKNFRRNGRFLTCGGWTDGSRTDVRVVAWTLGPGHRKATQGRTLLSGLPTSSGRHGGCRLLVLRDGSILVGTGDAAVGTNPQDLTSLGGKTLRMEAGGKPWHGNPWIGSSNRNRRYVWTYGHRNVQGLAQRADGTVWSAEHGPDRDDEVNLLRKGRNYGWNPVPGYNEGVPMTDHSLPGRQWNARWRSGSLTIATSGAAWVHGKRWGRLDGTLAVAALKASKLVFMKFDRDGRLLWTREPDAMKRFGRLRSVESLPGGALLVTTSNGSADKVVKVRPR